MIISAPAAFSSDAFALSGIIGADALIIPKKTPLVKVEKVFEQRIIASYLMSADQPKKHCDTRQSRQSVL